MDAVCRTVNLATLFHTVTCRTSVLHVPFHGMLWSR